MRGFSFLLEMVTTGTEKVKNLAPRARFELATLRLTAECSTIELPGNGLILQQLARESNQGLGTFESYSPSFSSRSRITAFSLDCFQEGQ